MAGHAQQAREDEIRSHGSLLAGLVIAGAMCLLPLVPAIRAVLHVDAIDVSIAMGVFAALATSGTILSRRLPPGARALVVFDGIETVGIQAAVLSLVLASGRGDSFFWIAWVAHAVVTGASTTNARFNRVAFGVMPALVAVGFAAWHEDLGAAGLALVIGAIGLQVFAFSAGVSRRLEAADAERSRLAAELSELRIREERTRIARDLHDGLGADLAALDWRLRALEGVTVEREQVGELTTRLAHGAWELRTIVWALRGPARAWADIVAYLRQRGAELGRERVEIEVIEQGVGPDAPVGDLGLDLVRAVLELVHNAVRHAGASRVRVSLGLEPGTVTATVEDDGAGLSSGDLDRAEGGLANVRARAARLGGSFELAASAMGGARITIALPTS